MAYTQEQYNTIAQALGYENASDYTDQTSMTVQDAIDHGQIDPSSYIGPQADAAVAQNLAIQQTADQALQAGQTPDQVSTTLQQQYGLSAADATQTAQGLQAGQTDIAQAKGTIAAQQQGTAHDANDTFMQIAPILGMAGIAALGGAALGPLVGAGSSTGLATGNELADAALNGAAKGALTSGVTGGDPLTGALTGGAGGGAGNLLGDAFSGLSTQAPAPVEDAISSDVLPPDAAAAAFTPPPDTSGLSDVTSPIGDQAYTPTDVPSSGLPDTSSPPTATVPSVSAPSTPSPGLMQTVKGIQAQIYQPLLQVLSDAGVPAGIVDAVPSILTPALTGAAISAITGGSPLTGAIVGGIAGGLTSQLGIPSSIANLAAGAAGSAITGGSGTTGGLPSGTTGGGSGVTGSTGSPTGFYSSTGTNNGWLDATPQVIKNTIPNRQNTSGVKQEDLTQLDPSLVNTLNDRGYQIPQDSQPQDYQTQGYADGGSTVDDMQPSSTTSFLNTLSGLSNIDPKYSQSSTVPHFLQTKVTDHKNAATQAQLLKLKNAISQYGNIGGYAKGGGLPKEYHDAAPEGHHPEFITGLTGYYADGKGTGQSDDIPAMLHEGDWVADSDVVSALGDGSSKAGRDVLDKFRNQIPHHAKSGGKIVAAKIADGEYVFPEAFVTALGRGDNKEGSKILDGMREKLREHKRAAPLNKIPPKSKSPLDYIKAGDN
jgi:hypothetical protein